MTVCPWCTEPYEEFVYHRDACRRHNRELATGTAPETEQATLGGGQA